MPDTQNAAKAIRELNGVMVDGRAIRLAEARRDERF